MDVQNHEKPCVLLYKHRSVMDEQLNPVLNGLEEEGIPCRIISTDDVDDLHLAHQASITSALSVGIGVVPNSITLTYKNLDAKSYVFRISKLEYPSSLRTLGINAARLVKGVPFIYDERLEVAF